MKKVIISFLLILNSCFALAQSSTNGESGSSVKSTAQQSVTTEVNELSVSVAKLFREGKFDEALPPAEKAVKLAEANGLFEKNLAINTLVNLAEVYIAKNRHGDAAELYEKAIGLYEKSPTASNKNSLAASAERLAFIQVKRNNFERAEKNYLKALAIREQVHGVESPQLINILLATGDFIRYIGKPDKAEAYFLRAVKISDQTYKPEDDEYGKVYSKYQCFVHQWKLQDADEYLKKFAATRDVKYPKPENPKIINGGVINGKALNLARPEYPDEAKAIRASGVVQVEVLINESGQVVSAKTTCGYDVFAKVAERAALKSKFSTTTLNGEPVKVSGTIVYRFIAQQ
jgi:TonB family protein